MASEDRISAFVLVGFDVLCSRVSISAALAGIFFASQAPAFASGAVVAGDSLGVGIALASGFENRAANSVSIRAGSAVEQLRKIRAGSTVFLSLGTNDAVGSVKGLEKGIERIVQTARASNLKLIWIGPPCVIKSWDRNAQELDGILSQQLAGTGVNYISMRDPSLCTPSMRGKDGVHFNMEGYRSMWSKAAAASGYQVASASPEAKLPPAQNNNIRTDRNPEMNTERPRVRTIVTSASLMPVASKKRMAASNQYFSFEFRWPETNRFSGSFLPSD